jgi:putative membrane protein
MRLFRYLALILFLAYLAVLPGSALTVALDRVPAWGEWMGGALLIGQGLAVLCWLLGCYGRRGALAAASIALLAWGVEQIGVTTGFPFGQYVYTPQLQPQLAGAVPLAIVCAWLMVAIGTWQLAENAGVLKRWKAQTFAAATLVLLLDLQIETVATKINVYWIWLDGGPYYGVPLANFCAWWLVGLGMAILVRRLLPPGALATHRQNSAHFRALCIAHYPYRLIPAALYLLSTLMFVVVNLARGYALAGLVGVAVLLGLGLYLALLWLGGMAIGPPRDAPEAE